MRLWHLIRWDARRHWLLLALWALMSVARVGLATLSPYVVLEADATAMLELAGGTLKAATFLLSVVLAPIILQSHPLVGSTAFWMTRPIPPAVLVAAKSLLLFATGIVFPTAAVIAATTSLGVPLRTMAGPVAGMVLTDVLWLALTMAYGALTQTLARYLIAVGATLACLVAALSVATASMMNRPFDEFEPQQWVPPTPTADMAGMVLFALALVAVPLVQAVGRSRRKSIFAGASGVAAAILISSAWPWPIFDPRWSPPAWSADASSALLAVRLETVQPERSTFTSHSLIRWRNVRARAEMRGLPEGWAASVQVLSAELRLGNGDVLVSRPLEGGYPSLHGEGGNAQTDATRAALGIERVEAAFTPRVEPVRLFRLRDADLRRVAPAKGRYVGRLAVVATQHHVEARSPLRPGLVSSSGAYRFEIVDVHRESDGITVTAAESVISSAFDSPVMTQRQFYLVNARCRCAVALHDQSGGFHTSILSLPVGFSSHSYGPLPKQRRLSYPPRQGMAHDSFVMDDDWLAEAELAIVRADTYPPFDRVLTIDDFPLQLPQPGTDDDESALQP